MATIIGKNGIYLLKKAEIAYSLTASTGSVNEGSSVTFTFTTTGTDGTFYWTNGGTTVAADFSDAVNSGSFVTTAGTGSIVRTLVSDVTTEGAETIVLQARTGGFGGTIVASSSVTVNDTSIAGIAPNWTVGAGGDFATLSGALASPSVLNGHYIRVLPGTYTLASTLTVNKEVYIGGTPGNNADVVLQSSADGAAPVNLISVSANNVLLKDLTIKHRKTTNTSIEAAVTLSAGGFPTFLYPTNFIMDSCVIEYLEFATVLRGDGFKLSNNRFKYATGTVGNSNRCIAIYGQKNNCFITNNIFDNSVMAATAFRPIYSTSTNGSSNETTTGALIVSGNSSTGTAVHQFYNQDNLRGTNNGYDLYFLNNNINETSLFVGLWNGANNVGDILGKIVLSGNTASGNHGGTPIGTKGMLTIDNTGTFRSLGNLPVYVNGNTQTNQTFRSGYVAVTQNPANTVSDYLLGRASAVTATFDVSTSIPSAPTAPTTPTLAAS